MWGIVSCGVHARSADRATPPKGRPRGCAYPHACRSCPNPSLLTACPCWHAAGRAHRPCTRTAARQASDIGGVRDSHWACSCCMCHGPWHAVPLHAAFMSAAWVPATLCFGAATCTASSPRCTPGYRLHARRSVRSTCQGLDHEVRPALKAPWWMRATGACLPSTCPQPWAWTAGRQAPQHPHGSMQ